MTKLDNQTLPFDLQYYPVVP